MNRKPHSAGRSPKVEVRLRLLQTSDVHARILPYDYLAGDDPDAPGGLAAAAADIATLRAEVANCLLFDCGDAIQGTPLADHIAYERGLDDGRAHPVIAAMNTLGYDAAAPGNHDFDYGLEFLTAALAGAAFPVVCANIAEGRTGATLFPAHVLLDRAVTDTAGRTHWLKIGVIGFVPPQTTDWDRHVFGPDVRSQDIVASARRAVPGLRASGADLVIALAHSGIADHPDLPRRENASLDLAQVPGIDAILAGHSHGVFPAPGTAAQDGVDAGAGTLHGVPAVMPGFNGSHLGVIDLSLTQEGGRWEVSGHRVEARPVGVVPPPDPVARQAAARVAKAVATAHDDTLHSLGRSIGRTDVPLHTFFSLVAPSAALHLIADAQRWALAAHLRDTPLAALPILSVATPYRAGGFAGPAAYTDIPAGALDQRTLSQLYIYPNVLQGIELTGAGLRAWLDRAAGVFRQIAPGSRDHPLHVRDAAAYDFDVIDGVGYRIDLSRPARFSADGRPLDPDTPSRIVDLTYRGRPVAPDDQFVLASNNYRLGGGGRYPGIDESRRTIEPRVSIRDVLLDYVRTQPRIALPNRDGWGFAELPGTSVRFQTGPGAQRVENDLPVDRFQRLGRTPEGFLAYRLWL